LKKKGASSRPPNHQQKQADPPFRLWDLPKYVKQLFWQRALPSKDQNAPPLLNHRLEAWKKYPHSNQFVEKEEETGSKKRIKPDRSEKYVGKKNGRGLKKPAWLEKIAV
jgi:hypothetical protein